MIRLVSPKQLKQMGILGMNRRNLDFIGRNNPRSLYPIVDNKLKTKQAAVKNNIPTPELYAVIDRQSQVPQLASLLAGKESFVIKPVQGSGGKGILVITGSQQNGWLKANGSIIDLNAINRHVSNILAGLHSLGGRNDFAMVEAKIDFDPLLNDYSFEGVPDIRVIIYKGIPVMAMMRCATRASDGKANLHQGAVGVGLDLLSGRSLHAVQHGRITLEHPDLDTPFHTLQVPKWFEVLQLAARCAEMTGLGYLGADIVIDRQHGPMLLEINARPGLSIQVANQEGLEKRLLQAESIARMPEDLNWKIRKAQAMFTRHDRE